MKMYTKTRTITETFYETECPKCHTKNTYKDVNLPFASPDSLACEFICPECSFIYEDNELDVSENSYLSGCSINQENGDISEFVRKVRYSEILAAHTQEE